MKQTLVVAALALIVFCLANPSLPGKTVMVTQEGLDIVIAVDVSDSMLVEDIKPSRLEKAKLELQDFISNTRGDRIGIVAFAGQAYIQAPLTLDRQAIKLFLKTLTPGLVPEPGTNLTQALEVSSDLFFDEESDNRVIVLLTDGEDHDNKPELTAKDLAKKGIRVFAIGIGTPKGEVIPVREADGRVAFKKDAGGNLIVSRLDEKTLQEIARITGGAYYRSRLGNLQVEQIYSDLKGLDKKETSSGWAVQYDPRYSIPLLGAVLLLALEALISERRRNA